jgi:hypothetical protein
MPRRMALALLLATILATPAVLANPLGEAHFQRSVILASGPMDSVTQLWHLLVRVWSKNGGQAGPNGVQTKNGGQIDPNGGNLPTPVPTTPNQNSNSPTSSQD